MMVQGTTSCLRRCHHADVLLPPAGGSRPGGVVVKEQRRDEAVKTYYGLQRRVAMARYFSRVRQNSGKTEHLCRCSDLLIAAHIGDIQYEYSITNVKNEPSSLYLYNL